jgi:hypothetical protein
LESRGFKFLSGFQSDMAWVVGPIWLSVCYSFSKTCPDTFEA